jgi:hypothetical protein
MPDSTERRARTRRERDKITFTVTIDGLELVRWHELAQQLGLTLEQLVRESVELAWARGSTR